MAGFKIDEKNRLQLIKEIGFKLEKEIQKLTEENLSTIFGLDLVKSEFAINKFRIDSLAYDKDSNAFVIIEYKRDKNFSVIDQGYAYLSLMLNNKADFILEYNENNKDSLKRDCVDWSQSKVMFISPSFTNYQKEAINFKDLPIELWEIKRYDNKTLYYNQMQTAGSQESVKTISRKDDNITEVSKQIKVYTEDVHLESASEEIKELYEKVKNAIQGLGDVEVKPKKHYISLVVSSSIISDILLQKNSLKLWINLNKGELDDPRNITRDVSKVGHLGNGAYEITISNDDNLEYILSLIKQAFKRK